MCKQQNISDKYVGTNLVTWEYIPREEENCKESLAMKSLYVFVYKEIWRTG